MEQSEHDFREIERRFDLPSDPEPSDDWEGREDDEDDAKEDN